MLRKPFYRRLLPICASLLIAVACSDPNVRKVEYFEEGNTLLAAGKVSEAILAYQNALKLDRKYGEARFQLARALEQRGDTNAWREYVRAADLMPEHFEAQSKAASALLKVRQFEQAQKHADKALTLKPRSGEVQIVRAFILAGLNDMDAALEEMERAAEFAPGDYRAYTSLGALQTVKGKPEEAEAAFKQAILTSPNASEPKLSLAYFYLSSRRWADAVRVLEDLLRTDPGSIPANRMLAYGNLSAGRVQEAETPLRRLAEAKDTRATLALADLYAMSNRRTEARPLYESLLADEKQRDNAVARLAALDYGEGRKADAYAKIDARLAKPTPPATYLILKAQFLTLDGRPTEAVEAARKAVAADPKSSQAQYWLGIALEQNRNDPAAIAAHTEALKLEPGMNRARVALSRLMAAVGSTQGALQHAQAAQAADPRSPHARLAVVRALLQKGDLAQAEVQVAPLTRQFPTFGAAQTMHGHVLLAKGDRAGAARHFDAALDIDAADADALVGRIQVDLSANRPQDARSRVERAIAHRPNDAPVLMAAARLEATDNKPQEAEKYLRRAIDADPTNLQAYGLLSRLYLKQNRLEDGKRELQHIAAKRKDAVAARTMIGMIEQLQGKQNEAIKTYEGILQDNSVAPLAANNLAYMYAEQNQRIDEAVRLAQRAKQQLPDSHEISDTLGWVYIKKGLPESAISPLEFSVAKKPQNPEYLYHLGLAYAKAGRLEQAQKALGDALRIKSDFQGADDARQTLASLR